MGVRGGDAEWTRQHDSECKKTGKIGVCRPGIQADRRDGERDRYDGSNDSLLITPPDPEM